MRSGLEGLKRKVRMSEGASRTNCVQKRDDGIRNGPLEKHARWVEWKATLRGLAGIQAEDALLSTRKARAFERACRPERYIWTKIAARQASRHRSFLYEILDDIRIWYNVRIWYDNVCSVRIGRPWKKLVQHTHR
jgi:hypothetical protein